MMPVSFLSAADSFAKFVYRFEYIKLNGFLRGILADNVILFFVLAAVWAVVSYIAGGLNFAILISKHIYHDDIRNYGSKNAGFTNMKRVFGGKAAAAVMIGDTLKTVVSVAVALFAFGCEIAALCGVFCILGHCFPCFYGFKGGKGVAATAAMVLVLDPLTFLTCILLFILIVAASKYLSLGSVMMSLLYPLIQNRIYTYMHSTILPELYVKHGLYSTLNIINGAVTVTPDMKFTMTYGLPTGMLLVAFFVAVFIPLKHIPNIKRIMDGTENRFYFGKNKNKHSFEPPAEQNGKKSSLHRIDELDDELNDRDNR